MAGWNPFESRLEPGTAFVEKRSRKQRKGRRFCEAAQHNRLTSGFVTTTVPPVVSIEQGLPQLRARARHAYENNDFIKAFVRACLTNIIGHRGVMLQSRVMTGGGEADQLARTEIENAWREWGRKGGGADFTLQRSFWQLQRDVVQSCAIDGEYLAIKRITPRGLQLQSLDPEMLPVGYSEDRTDGSYIRQGIQYDQNDRVTGYWFHKERPQRSRSGYVTGYGAHGADYRFIRADRVLHVYLPEYSVQCRGVPWVAAGLLRLGLLHGYQEAELFAARTAASQMGFLIDAADGETYEGEGTDAEGIDEFEAEPGVWRRLPYGMDVKPPDTSRPNPAFEAFIKANVRFLAAGLGVSYASISGDFSDANYSSMRAASLIEQEVWKTLQTFVMEQFHDPVFIDWLELAIDTGTLLIAGQEPVRPLQQYMPRSWQPRRWAWVDPAKEMKAHGEAIDRRLKSRSEVIREMGRDPEEVWREIQEENAMFESLGIAPNDVTPATPPEPMEEE